MGISFEKKRYIQSHFFPTDKLSSTKIIVKKGLDFLKKRTKNKGVKIVAYVKQSNVPSIKIFKKLSFVDMGLVNVKNVNLIRFELTL